ncbi:MAG: 16S rRNA (cytosine(1402)-N(4))-methyltransferase RsmH, partial [Verrucomicrobiota bacterium]
DLGVSSPQLDLAERGFSFRESGPLDMRMDQRADFSARDLVNDWSEDEMTRIFREYGEERAAARAAKAIIEARANAAIETTGVLAEVVASVVPKVGRRHPATKVFQAIRIAVNKELESLELALEKSIHCLSSGGVLAVISFHSLEDRIVKQFMRRHSQEYLDRPEWPAPRPNPDYHFTLPSRRISPPDVDEVARNPRSRSAKLRVAVKN